MQILSSQFSCLPFDDSYGDWASVDAWTAPNEISDVEESGYHDFQSVRPYLLSESIYAQKEAVDVTITGDMAWCPTDISDIELVSTLSAQSWRPGNSFSYTFDEWTSSPSCDDLVVDYNQLTFYRYDGDSYVDAGSYFSFDSVTRTVTSLSIEPEIDDIFFLLIEGVANDGQCKNTYFAITNPCRSNELS